MRDIWSFLLQTLTASGAAVLLLIVKAMFRDKLSPRWQFQAWGVLTVILLLPAGLFGRYVLLNWLFLVELLRSVLTGEYGVLTHVIAPVPLPALAVPRSWTDWLFVLYEAGVLFLLARYALSYARLRRALRQGRPVENGRLQAVAEQYSLPVCPAVEVDGLPSAFICGVFKPVLALPAGTETDDKILLHELLHLKHRDAAWGLVIGFFRCIHWCNPLLWYCADLAGNDLESLCDQRVLERLEGEDRRDYGRILLDMADEKYARAPGTSSMANGGRNIRRRIEAIARFKRYPAGMGLVSVCILLALAAPLVIGVKAAAVPDYPSRMAQMVYARTLPCTTCDGALDTYAKAVLTGRTAYRAMCAPMAEQNELAEKKWPDLDWCWPDISWKDMVDSSAGYQYYNLAQVEEDVYEGLLVFKLNQAPVGETWDSTINNQWLAVRTVRAEKEGDRWVVIPQGEFQAVQGDIGVHGNKALPYQTYEAQWGEFTFRLLRQTASYVDSMVQSGSGFFSVASFNSTPQPGGEFQNEYSEEVLAFYSGSPADWAQYTSIGAVCAPMWEGQERPELTAPGVRDSSFHSSSRQFGGSHSVDGQDREDEAGIYLSGGGGSGDLDLDLADSYAMNFYLNDEKAAELTLLPVERGTSLD